MYFPCECPAGFPKQPGVDSAGDGAQHQQGQEDAARCGGSEAGSGEYEFHCQKNQQRFQREVALCNPAHQPVSASQSNRVCKEADVGHGQAHRQLGKRRNISLAIHFSGLWVQPPSSRPLLGQCVGRRAYPVRKDPASGRWSGYIGFRTGPAPTPESWRTSNISAEGGNQSGSRIPAPFL